MPLLREMCAAHTFDVAYTTTLLRSAYSARASHLKQVVVHALLANRGSTPSTPREDSGSPWLEKWPGGRGLSGVHSCASTAPISPGCSSTLNNNYKDINSPLLFFFFLMDYGVLAKRQKKFLIVQEWLVPWQLQRMPQLAANHTRYMVRPSEKQVNEKHVPAL